MSLWAFRAGQNARELLAWGLRGSRAPSAVPRPGTRGAHCRCSTSHPQRPRRPEAATRSRAGTGSGERPVWGRGPPLSQPGRRTKHCQISAACAPDSGLRPPHSHPHHSPPQGWCLALRECLGCHGRLKAPLCPRETQGPGRGEKSVGADGPQGRGGAGGLLGRGLLHAHLSLHAHGHQGWPKQGRAPQQHLRGWRCLYPPWRTVDHDELAEVELVSEPSALGPVQDPLTVVISGESRGESTGSAGRVGRARHRGPGRVPLPRPARLTTSCPCDRHGV